MFAVTLELGRNLKISLDVDNLYIYQQTTKKIFEKQ